MLNNVCIRKYSNRYFTNLSAVMYILLFSESPQHLIKVKIVQKYFFFFFCSGSTFCHLYRVPVNNSKP